MPIEELVERQAVALQAGIVLAEAGVDLDRGVTERRRDQLGGLDGALVVAGLWRSPGRLAGLSEADRQPLALAALEVG